MKVSTGNNKLIIIAEKGDEGERSRWMSSKTSKKRRTPRSRGRSQYQSFSHATDLFELVS